MQVLDYLYKYQNIEFKELAFNEIDALLLAMVSYFPFDEMNNPKASYSSDDLLKRIKEYVPPINVGERKLKYIAMTEAICRSKRFNNARFSFFRKKRDTNSAKQFQAITIILRDFVYVSFCGTDSTTIGWKEDLNMAYLEVVPSEVEAISYLKEVSSYFLFRKIYVGGHSKGGRLAVSAAKGLGKLHKLLGVYAFDAPNFPPSCYDTGYKAIVPLLHEYTPEESIFGRLMNEYSHKKIVASSNTLLMQHDAFSWLIEDHSFVYKKDYTERSTHIVNTINYALYNYDEDMKKEFIDTIFDLLERLNIEKLPSEKDFIPFFASRLALARGEWKNTSKEKKAVIKKMLFNISKDYLLKKKN